MRTFSGVSLRRCEGEWGLGFRLQGGLCVTFFEAPGKLFGSLWGACSVGAFAKIPACFKFKPCEVIVAWMEMFSGTWWLPELRRPGITPSAG